MDLLWTSPKRHSSKVGVIKTSIATTLSLVGVLATGGAAFAANTTVLGSIIPSFQRSSTLAVAETIVPFVELSINSSTIGGTAVVNTTVLAPTVSFVATETTVPTETTLPITNLQINSTTSVVPAVFPSAVTTTTTLASVVTAPTTLAPAGTTQSNLAPSTGQFAYNIAGVGIVTLKQNAASLEIVSVKPVSGWTYGAKNESVTRVEIEFENGTKKVEFRAQLLDGRIITAVTVEEETDDETDDADKSGTNTTVASNSGSSNSNDDEDDEDEEDD